MLTLERPCRALSALKRRIIYIMLNSGGLKGGGRAARALFISASAVVLGLFAKGWIFKPIGTKVKTKSLGKPRKGTLNTTPSPPTVVNLKRLQPAQRNVLSSVPVLSCRPPP